jgi:two-component system response regulator YesN
MYKVIIVEDEALIREGIINSINKSDCGFEVVGEAEDGEQALQLIKEKMPEVLITDISMPKMNGLELVECVREINPEVKVIIISGHDDFKYAQKALSIGVQDYLLKPVLPEKINDILSKIKEDIIRQQSFLLNVEDLKKQVLESLPIVKERFFNEIINGKLSNDQIISKSKYLNVDFQGDLYGVVLLKTKQPNDVVDSSVRKIDMVQYFISDIVDKIFDQSIKVYTCALTDYETVLLFCIKEKSLQNAFITINQSVSRVVISLQKYLNVKAFASIGKLYNSIYDFKRSYEEATEALNYSTCQKSCSIINYEDVCSQKAIAHKKPVDLETKLILSIKLCERLKSMDYLEKLFEFYNMRPIEDIRRIKIDIFELVILLFRNIEESEGSFTESLYGKQISFYEEIQKCDDIYELRMWLLGFIEAYISELEKMHVSRSVSLVEKVKEMINACVSDENFSLNDVASKFFISPNYLRQIFKQHTGESFVEYLTHIRMEKAVTLLKDPTLKIQYVAEQVGYSNQRYFAICFKKQYQLTPTDYREIEFMKS